MTIQTFTWDWKDQAPLDKIGAAVTVMSGNGQVFTYQPDTHGDSYGLVLSSRELTAGQAEQVLTYPDAVVKVEVTIEPAWMHGPHTDIIDVPLAELIGLEGMAREVALTEACADYVNNMASWGTSEGATVLFPEED